jgi:hypothetical protein
MDRADFGDKGGKELNGWTGENGEDISEEKRLDFGERRERVDRSPHERRYFPPRSHVPKFQSLREQMGSRLFFVSVDLINPYKNIIFCIS